MMQVTFSLLLIVLAAIGLLKLREIASVLERVLRSRIMHTLLFIVWCIILAILVFVWGFIVHGLLAYLIDESVRNDADLKMEKFIQAIKPKRTVIVKKTPVNHARTVTHVKHAKRYRRLSVWRALRMSRYAYRASTTLAQCIHKMTYGK